MNRKTARGSRFFRRWGVERTFAWMGHCRLLAKGYKRRLASSLGGHNWQHTASRCAGAREKEENNMKYPQLCD
ncbi:MAG: hypothetical protein F4073_05160 [Rhodobacteraceae bacterium]|nr:hypothetical protein [Paracoccaceae bacterium]MXZ50607.1 hypothetical protein [Paracoccaceae bacterium]MYF45173.1 hypothetical protein [Paracoccaceae bacterium]MYI91326.1 hypothetical protein [Paracoccaceae bacterium]MYJ86754.1 hypothetical protein [Paracoccaceae bacterium]